MDIIDVLVAKALTPQGQIESYAAQAQAAVSNINSITAQTNTNNTNAAKALADVNAALAALEAAGVMDAAGVDAEVKKLVLSISNSNTNSVIGKGITTTYPDNTTRTLSNVVKYYKSTGNNEDGTMTQKAITAALEAIPSSGGSGGGGSGNVNVGAENAGEFVIVGENGDIVASSVQAEDLITSLLEQGILTLPGTVGLKIDYVNKSTIRSQESRNYSMGADFNKYSMFGGRKRCVVADNGTINAFYGEEEYVEDGSNGQVMVYQPKFYYCRIPTQLEGKIIRNETLILSNTARPGFKLHPLFIDTNGHELEYVLLSAYDGCAYNTSASAYNLTDSTNVNYAEDKLSSIANAKPISGLDKELTAANAEKLATNRGEGWHITNMAAESANQMLEIIEFGTLNGQVALEAGIVDVPNTVRTNCSSITGSTASLGNASGAASSTISEANGNRTTYNTSGRRAISYRGMENPWGNIWRFIGGVNVTGDGTQHGGHIYICSNYDYNIFEITNDYREIPIDLPNESGYTSAFGYDEQFDWVFIAAENNGNSSIPVGDKTWVISDVNSLKSAQFGGSWISYEAAGIFHYDFDQAPDMSFRTTGARLMFIPTINNIYEANIEKWQANMED